LAKGGVNTPPAEWGPHKTVDFVGFIARVDTLQASNIGQERRVYG